MRGLSVRWLLVAVATLSLIVPVVVVLSLRSFDSVLIRQTESELNAQGALIAAAYQEAWAKDRGVTTGNPRDRVHLTNSYTPNTPLLADEEAHAPALPDPLPKRPHGLTESELRIGQSLSRVLENAQVFNLSGVRVLAPDGCAIASSRAQIGDCFSDLPEVKRALAGQPAAALRPRVSDEPAPPLTSFRRRGDTRVFVAKPIWNDGQIIGAVLLSRTAESGLEWLFKRRKGVLVFAAFVVGLTTLVGVAFSWSITRPLSQMARLLRTEGESRRLAEVKAPREIHALGQALDERAERLESKNRYIAEFSANVSHELKTPLTSIRGAVELLLEAEDSMPPEQRRVFLENIDAAVSRTERLVSRLLVLARLEAPEREAARDRVAVVDYARALVERYEGNVELEIAGDPGELPPVSETALEAVLGNLIENALRYRRSQPVRVRLAMVEGKARPPLHIIVEDDGPGITPENQKHLFERFFTTERDRGGTGLGLSIVRATARRRGGDATITSSSEGTRVEVWL